MTERKRAAIIGFGGMGQRHYSAYSKIGVDVVAISDIYPDKIRSLVPSLDTGHIYADYKKLIADEHDNIDILSVVTNGPTHAAVTIEGAKSGIRNILCEKPMATNLHSADQVLQVCRENGTRLAVNHIRRWSSDYAKLKALLDDGVIGDIRHLYFSCGSTGIGNFAIHFFDTARYLTGDEPVWITGYIDKTGTPNPRGCSYVDPGGYGIIQFKKGARFYFDTSEDTGVQYSFQIVGTYGRIIIDELNTSWQIRARPAENRKLPLTRYGADMEIFPFTCSAPFDIVDLTSNAMKNLLSGEPIRSTGSDGKRSLEMVMGAHCSDVMENKRISLPLSQDNYDRDVKIA